MQRENERTDILTRKSYPKEKLLRFTLAEGKISLSPKGRGYYLLKEPTLLDRLKGNKAMQRLLHRDISEEEIALLKGAL